MSARAVSGGGSAAPDAPGPSVGAGGGGQKTRATAGRSNIDRNTDTPSTMLDRILLSRVFQSWTYQRWTASTRSRISLAASLSVRSIRCVMSCFVRTAISSSVPRVITSSGSTGCFFHIPRGHVVDVRGVVVTREDDPRLAERVGERLRLFDFLGEELLVDGAMVDVLQRHPVRPATRGTAR